METWYFLRPLQKHCNNNQAPYLKGCKRTPDVIITAICNLIVFVRVRRLLNTAEHRPNGNNNITETHDSSNSEIKTEMAAAMLRLVARNPSQTSRQCKGTGVDASSNLDIYLLYYSPQSEQATSRRTDKAEMHASFVFSHVIHI